MLNPCNITAAHRKIVDLLGGFRMVSSSFCAGSGSGLGGGGVNMSLLLQTKNEIQVLARIR